MELTKGHNCKNMEISTKSKDEVIYRIWDQTGEVFMSEYQVFPGIKLIFNDVHMGTCNMNQMDFKDVLEINHCREGRMECTFVDELFYITPGDLSITRKRASGEKAFFPIKHYHGITIVIDLEQAPKCLSCLLDDVNVRPTVLVNKYCSDNPYFVVRSNPCLEHIFSELYAVPESIRQGYFKVKILELLLFLSSMNIGEQEISKAYLTKYQVDLAKEVGKYLTAQMEKKITIEQLSKVFHVSQTALKNNFKEVYGVSVYTYIKEQKMQAAAQLLCNTEQSVLKVAGQFGYDNPSKFAGAFRTVLGSTPNKYRKRKK